MLVKAVMLTDLFKDTASHFDGIASPERAAFDATFYRANNSDVDFAEIEPLEHYCLFGRFEGRRPTSEADCRDVLSERGRAVYDLLADAIDASGYFGSAAIAEGSDIDPLLHYFAWGHERGFSFGSSFEPQYYLDTNQDVRMHGLDPLVHYSEFGVYERRLTSPGHRLIEAPSGWIHRADAIRPFFDTEFYITQLPWIADTTVDAPSHYLRFGEAAGYWPTPTFNPTTKGPGSEGTTAFELHLSGSLPKGEDGVSDPFACADTDGLHVAEHWPEVEWDVVASRTGFDVGKLYLGRQLDGPVNHKCRDDQTASLEHVDQIFVQRAARQARDKRLSLDLWDTLIRRSVAPDAVKLRTARYLWLRTWRRISPDKRLSHTAMFQARRAAEAQAADDSKEYTFEDATTRWLELFGIRDRELVAALQDRETSFECETAEPDPTIGALLKAHDRPYVVVSDFYHSAETLRTIIASTGVPLPDTIYSSCDVMASKRQGGLYALVANSEAMAPEEIFHIGDRKMTDCGNARRAGFEAMHYLHPAHLARNEALDQGFWSMIDGDLQSHHAELLSLVGAKDIGEELPTEALGIVVLGLVMDIVETATKLGVRDVFFLSREGLFFKEVYDLVVAEDVYDLGSYPASKSLYVSRRATFGASIEEPDIASFMRVWSQYSRQSLAAFLTTINCDPKDFVEAAADANLPMTEDIDLPWEDPRMQSFLADDAVRAKLREALWVQRDALVDYLEKEGFEPRTDRTRCIVDIGWRGSIQDNLSEVCRGSIVGCYLGLETFLNDQTKSGGKAGYAFDLNVEDERLVHDFAALEFVFNVAGGSVTGYNKGAPLRDKIADEEGTVETHVRPLQTRILGILKGLARHVRQNGLVAADLRGLSRDILEIYFNAPPSEVADAFKALEHNESFGTGDSQHVGSTAKGLKDLKGLNGADLHAGCLALAKGMRWHESLHAQSRVAAWKSALGLNQRLHLPTTLFAPAVLRRSSLGDPGVVFFAPGPIVGSGGHRTILSAANKVSLLGAPVSVMFEAFPGPAEREWVAGITGPDVKVYDCWSSETAADLAVATIDYSAAYVAEYFAQKSHTNYFVQDFEAAFNPVSDAYLRAERSYTLTANRFTIGRWLSHRIHAEYGVRSGHGGLGVDGQVYRTDAEVGRRDRIAFLYQPEKPRRASDLCIEALGRVKDRLPHVEIVLFGSDRHASLPFDNTQLGLLTDLGVIAKLYQSSKVGLCLSATNPSRIPYEMMACGCVPIDIYRYNNLFDYGGGAGCLAYQSAASLAEAIARPLEDAAAFDVRQNAGFDWVSSRSLDWESDAFANQTAFILDGVAIEDLEVPAPNYTDAPVVAPEDDVPEVWHYLDHQWALACRGVNAPDRAKKLKLAS